MLDSLYASLSAFDVSAFPHKSRAMVTVNSDRNSVYFTIPFVVDDLKVLHFNSYRICGEILSRHPY